MTAVLAKEVEAKLADGRTGVIPKSDFETGQAPSVGDHLDVVALVRDDPKRRVVLSRSWAVKQQGWDRVEAAKEAGTPLVGPVVKVVKGGVIVDLGVRAFLPHSLLDEHPVADLSSMVGTEVTVMVTEADREHDRVVVSRRDHLRRVRRDAEKAAYASLLVGGRVVGKVVGIVEYGIQVEVAGVRGLLHRSEFAWGRLPRPSDVASMGDEIEMVVTEVNRSKHRVGLSLRRLTPDPLDAIEVGVVTTAVVTKVIEYGVIARLSGSDVEGLVHMSELSDLPGYRPDELVTPGDEVAVKVISIDPVKRRVALSVRQALYL